MVGASLRLAPFKQQSGISLSQKCRMELISPVLRVDFREFCVVNMVLRQIEDIFKLAGVKRGKISSDSFIRGQRRTLVEEYYASLDWRRRADCDKFLQVLSHALAQSYFSGESRLVLKSIIEKEGLVVDGARVQFRNEASRTSKHTSASTATLAELKDRLIRINGLEAQARGYEFERFLGSLFEAHGLAPRSSFRLIGEQIDGSFIFDSDVYLVEAKWQKKLTSQDDLLVFRGKVESKSAWTRGLFVSYGGFSEDGMAAFARGRATNIIGMNSQDLYYVVSNEISLFDAIARKMRWAAETGEFFKSVFDLLYM